MRRCAKRLGRRSERTVRRRSYHSINSTAAGVRLAGYGLLRRCWLRHRAYEPAGHGVVALAIQFDAILVSQEIPLLISVSILILTRAADCRKVFEFEIYTNML